MAEEPRTATPCASLVGEPRTIPRVTPPGPAALGHSYPPAVRLHTTRDFGRVMNRQQKAAGRSTVLLLRPGPPGGVARLGVMVAVKTVRLAVRRHQLKRWVRELFRTRLRERLGSHDVVVLFRSDPGDHAALDAELEALAAKALAAKPQPDARRGRGGRR